MQIWRITRSSPGTSYMKARLVSLWCFALTMFPQETLALSSICSVLIRCAYELLCFWMRREGIEIFCRSPLRENSGSMQFVETKKKSSRSPRELKFVVLCFRIEDLRKIVLMTSLCGVWWCSNTTFMANNLPRLKRVLLEWYPLSQRKKLFAFASIRTESYEANTTVQ